MAGAQRRELPGISSGAMRCAPPQDASSAAAYAWARSWSIGAMIARAPRGVRRGAGRCPRAARRRLAPRRARPGGRGSAPPALTRAPRPGRRRAAGAGVQARALAGVVEPGQHGGDDGDEQHGQAQRGGRAGQRQQVQRHRDVLRQALELAAAAGRDHPVAGQHAAHDGDGDLAAEHDRGRPPGQRAEQRQADQGGADERLVGDRVGHDAEVGDLAAAAREVAVDDVGEAGQDEQRRRPAGGRRRRCRRGAAAARRTARRAAGPASGRSAGSARGGRPRDGRSYVGAAVTRHLPGGRSGRVR